MIGLFVIVGMALLITVVLWLGASKLFQEYHFYITYFNTSVQGLEAGQPVKYQGVPVGNIQSLGVASDGKLIQVVIRINKNVALNDSMRIRIEMASIAGAKYLLLFYPDHPQSTWGYPDISILNPEYPVIRSAPSSMEEIRVSLSEAINNLMAIDTRGISIQSVRTLRAISELLEKPELSDIVGNVNRSSLALSRLLGAADTARFVSSLQVVTNDAQQMSKNLVMMSESLVRTSQQMERMAATIDTNVQRLDLASRVDKAFSRYDSVMVTIGKSATSVGKQTELSLGDVRSLVQELRAASREIRRSARSLSDNPGRALFAEPPPKEK